MINTVPIPVNSFTPMELPVITGLRQRFAENPRGFEDVRIAVVKDEDNETAAPYEIIVSIKGGMSLHNDTIREAGVNILVFADGYAEANELASVVCEYLQSLTALGKIKYVSIESAGTHIENPGPQQLRLITASIRVRATTTTLY